MAPVTQLSLEVSFESFERVMKSSGFAVCVCVSSQLLSHDNTVVHFSNKIIVSFFK